MGHIGPYADFTLPYLKGRLINTCQIGQEKLQARLPAAVREMSLRRHGWTREDSFVLSLNQSDNRPQIFVGHKLFCQFGLRPMIADDGELINGKRENFRDNEDRKFRNKQQEMLEIFVNGRDVFIFQPTNCMNLKPQSNDAALLKKTNSSIEYIIHAFSTLPQQ